MKSRLLFLQSYIPSEFLSREPIPVWFLDSEGRGWGYRAFKATLMESQADDIADAFQALAEDDSRNPDIMKSFANQSRGPHNAIIIGHYRQSSPVCSLYIASYWI